MKLLRTFPAVASVALAVLSLCSCASTESQAHLESQAKITKAQAQKTALAHVKHGTVKQAELEKENGKLIWSFDIAMPGTKNIAEVSVDAITGDFIKKEIETPAQQAKEAAEDAKKKS